MLPFKQGLASRRSNFGRSLRDLSRVVGDTIVVHEECDWSLAGVGCISVRLPSKRTTLRLEDSRTSYQRR